MGETAESTRKIANNSGFPFQIWLGDYIDESTPQHGWEVLSTEVRWVNERTGQEEYVDLVLSHKQFVVFRAVIEAKRRRDAVWVFLQPDKEPVLTRRFRYFWTYPEGAGGNKMGWYDGYLMQKEPLVSSFCAVRGQAEERPLLERLAGYTLLAAEALGRREIEVRTTTGLIYLPVIVTTAELVVHRFDPKTVKPESGDFEKSEYLKVPYIVFRKSIGTVYPVTAKRRDHPARDLSDLNRQDERDVLIVNSRHVVAALEMLATLQLKGDFEDIPWRPFS